MHFWIDHAPHLPWGNIITRVAPTTNFSSSISYENIYCCLFSLRHSLSLYAFSVFDFLFATSIAIYILLIHLSYYTTAEQPEQPCVPRSPSPSPRSLLPLPSQESLPLTLPPSSALHLAMLPLRLPRCPPISDPPLWLCSVHT